MIPLFKPYMPDLPEMDAILHSGALAYGDYTKRFEDKLREYFGTPLLITTSSFDKALWVVFAALDLSPGDSLIASPMGCLASTQPCLAAGLKVRWADIDPLTGTLNPDSVRRELKPGIRAILHNHFCGYPGYIDEINAVGREYGIPVIDDGIECFGTEYKGKKVGACGTDATVFSLGAVRIPNCIDGGVVIFREREQYEKALLIRDCGIDRHKFRDELGEISPDCDISLVGLSATMSNANGYIGLKQMEYADALLKAQRGRATKWDEELSGASGVCPLVSRYGVPNYWVYGLLARDKRKTIHDFRKRGLYASGVHYNNSNYSVFDKQNVPLPGVEKFSNEFVAIPCGWWTVNDKI